MASIVVNRGLQVIGRRASGITSGTPTTGTIQTMAVDDGSTAFAAAHTTLLSPTNLFDKSFDATPTISSQTVSHVMTVPAGSGNFTIRRISLHNDTTSAVTGASSRLVAGIDGQSLTKTSDFSMTITVSLSYTSS